MSEQQETRLAPRILWIPAALDAGATTEMILEEAKRLRLINTVRMAGGGKVQVGSRIADLRGQDVMALRDAVFARLGIADFEAYASASLRRSGAYRRWAETHARWMKMRGSSQWAIDALLQSAGLPVEIAR